jgi:hypothetical protein
MVALSEWLQLMLAEIARKRDDLELARAEDARRATEAPRTHGPAQSNSTPAPEQKAPHAREPV